MRRKRGLSFSDFEELCKAGVIDVAHKFRISFDCLWCGATHDSPERAVYCCSDEARLYKDTDLERDDNV
jgi:adenosine deaminase